MSTIRIIPRMDVKGPNLIKGICLEGHRVLGTPSSFATIYNQSGADEVLYIDNVASLYQRGPNLAEIRNVASCLSVPLTVVGGISTIEQVRAVLASGADKVGINTAAIKNPNLLRQASDLFGAQCIVSSVEAFKRGNGRYEAWTDSGREPTGKDVFDWMDEAVAMGCGEILITSIEEDGKGNGFDLNLCKSVADRYPVPVIASGGAGKMSHFVDVGKEAGVNGIAAASIFHYHYAKAPGTLWMSYEDKGLRMGNDVDAGNVDFLNYGYGADRSLMVEPTSIDQVKAYMSKAHLQVRPFVASGNLKGADRR